MNIELISIIGNEGAKIPFDGEVVISDNNISANLKITGKVSNLSERLQVTADVDSDIKTFCDRCLVPIQTKLTFAIEEVVGENEITMNGTVLDIGDIARRNFFANLPMKFLCQENCNGLCANCGENLNIKKCDCEHDIIDERFAALKKLLEK